MPEKTREINSDETNLIGARLEQVRCEAPEYQKFVGRRGTVDDVVVDERGQIHVRTQEDGVWAPLRLMSAI